MSKVLQYRKADRRFEAYGDDAAKASIARLVGPETSRSMGAGVAQNG